MASSFSANEPRSRTRDLVVRAPPLTARLACTPAAALLSTLLTLLLSPIASLPRQRHERVFQRRPLDSEGEDPDPRADQRRAHRIRFEPVRVAGDPVSLDVHLRAAGALEHRLG